MLDLHNKLCRRMLNLEDKFDTVMIGDPETGTEKEIQRPVPTHYKQVVERAEALLSTRGKRKEFRVTDIALLLASYDVFNGMMKKHNEKYHSTMSTTEDVPQLDPVVAGS